MKKPIIIFGDKPQSPTGKSFLANQIALAFNKSAYLCARVTDLAQDKFFFHGVEADTDLIIIDNVRSRQFQQIVDMIIYPETIHVNSKGLWPFTMNRPQVIITIEEDEAFLRNQSKSVLRRCDFIKTSLEAPAAYRHVFIKAEKVNLTPYDQ